MRLRFALRLALARHGNCPLLLGQFQRHAAINLGALDGFLFADAVLLQRLVRPDAGRGDGLLGAGSLGPVRANASDNASGRERVRELFVRTFPRFKEFEPQLRAAAQLSLEQGALERAGLLEEEPYRRGHRIRILAHAIAPLAPELPPAVRDRLHRALSIVYGIEPYIILKDIWGLPDREVEGIALWMADALIDAALRDARALAEQPRPARKTARR